jgi:hypothetical protein
MTFANAPLRFLENMHFARNQVASRNYSPRSHADETSLFDIVRFERNNGFYFGRFVDDYAQILAVTRLHEHLAAVESGDGAAYAQVKRRLCV